MRRGNSAENRRELNRKMNRRNKIIEMLDTTKKRYMLVRKEVYNRLGKMPIMMAYTEVAQQMGLSEETVEKL